MLFRSAVIRGAAAEQKVRELKVENQQLQQKIPSTKEKLKEAQERQRLENEKPAAQSEDRVLGRRFELGARDFGAAPGAGRYIMRRSLKTVIHANSFFREAFTYYIRRNPCGRNQNLPRFA